MRKDAWHEGAQERDALALPSLRDPASTWLVSTWDAPMETYAELGWENAGTRKWGTGFFEDQVLARAALNGLESVIAPAENALAEAGFRLQPDRGPFAPCNKTWHRPRPGMRTAVLVLAVGQARLTAWRGGHQGRVATIGDIASIPSAMMGGADLDSASVAALLAVLQVCDLESST